MKGSGARSGGTGGRHGDDEAAVVAAGEVDVAHGKDVEAGTGEAVQGFFPLFFVLLFLSSAFYPRDLIEQDSFRTVATYNPVSYMVEGIRSLVISGWDGQALAQAFGISLVAIVLFLALSSRALRTRLART